MPLSWKHGASPSRCEVVCPCAAIAVAAALGVVGVINWEQGFFFSPDESMGGCQGPEYHLGDKERQWRSAWTGDCAFLYRNEPEDQQVLHWKSPRSEEYDQCYRLACKEFCASHWCMSKSVATAVWTVALLLVLAAVICCAMVGYKIGWQMCHSGREELGCSASMCSSTTSVV
mmetsp:Transcript_31170/g.58493  ORF Transcript_31170/g.58493 Transcript_31170/m.58493 type:complete len:173 (-) Transcript_31170:131-649(-)